jgi:putative FmdB family regulatory protein
MPTYEYRCAKCGEHLEVFQSFSEAPLTKHAHCGGKLAKVLSPAGIVLKGSGFYKTDSRSGNGSSKSKSKSKDHETTGAGAKASEKSSDSSGRAGGENSGSKPETKSA